VEREKAEEKNRKKKEKRKSIIDILFFLTIKEAVLLNIF